MLKTNIFIKNRLVEFVGLLLIVAGFFIIIAIGSYSPEDPNFIYNPENSEIKNLAGYYGSVASDFLLQSIGLVSLFMTINLLNWGYVLMIRKKITNISLKIFFTLTYIIFGTTFLSIFSNNSFWLIDNGNGGFVGRIIKENFYVLTNLIENQYVIIVLLLLSIIFFSLSLSLKFQDIIKIIILPYLIVKKVFNIFTKNNQSTSKIEERDLNENLKATSYNTNTKKQDQPNLPFESIKSQTNKVNFKLPPLNFLEKNSLIKKKKIINESQLEKNSEFLEKILLDFGVEGKIKRISYGPVVTLYEFEPASGVKVSKIVNLADDIARNTSSISTRVATIPGKNTVGIEIPN